MLRMNKEKYERAVLDLSYGMLDTLYPMESRLWNFEYLNVLQDAFNKTDDAELKNFYDSEIKDTRKKINSFDANKREVELLNKIKSQDENITAKKLEIEEIMKIVKNKSDSELVEQCQYIIDKWEGHIKHPAMRL
jgi:hypothetical protein